MPNFFVTFLEVLKDRAGEDLFVERGVTSGDYLLGFLLGTRTALFDKGRSSLTITIDEVSPFTLGALIALYERAVGFYASLVGINAYHQPGVEAGKKAAATVIQLQQQILAELKKQKGKDFSIDQLAAAIGSPDEQEAIYKILEHLSSNPGRGIQRKGNDRSPEKARYHHK